ncbi:MAG: aminoglycoside 3'-phosphotransferase [Ruminococcaceae bacterium]|nr:aminoglycoside 3'-phosphotransferase [Oscillospiraceae bacterium]
MKRTLLKALPDWVPAAFRPRLSDAAVYDSSCSPEARVLYVERDGGCFLKCAPAGTLKTEAEMNAYFHRLGLSAPVLYYGTEGERDVLLTARVPGEDCTHGAYLAEPARLATLLGERLRALHDLPCDGCPIKDRTATYLVTVREGYRLGRFDPSFLPEEAKGMNMEESYQTVWKKRHFLQTDTLLHGDYCLPNVLLDDWRFSGFIDLGNGGVGDRHVDLFWGAWTLRFNLGTDAYKQRFFDAYGRDAIDRERLLLVGIAECFG